MNRPYPMVETRERLNPPEGDVALLPILLVAFALRTFRLDGQSLWADEGASVVMAGRALPDIINATTADIHPPLYYILLSWWAHLSGYSEFGLRFLSVIFGVLLVALTFRLCRSLFQSQAGLMAAFFATLSPLLVYYSQEMRMYMPVATLSTLSMLLFLKLTMAWKDKPFAPASSMESGAKQSHAPGGVGLYIAYVLAAAASLYTQYLSLTVLLAENLLFALIFRPWKHGRLWVRWASMQAIIALIFLPWMPIAWNQLKLWPSKTVPLSIDAFAQAAFWAFHNGPLKLESAWVIGAWVALIITACSSLWLAVGRGSPTPGERSPLFGWGFLLLYFLVPLLLIYGASRQRPFFDAKFLLFSAPAYYGLLGLGTASLYGALKTVLRWPWIPGLASATAAVAIIYLGALPLNQYYFDPRYGRDDYRGLARYIQSSFDPQDAIIVNAPGQIEIFRYYYKGELPTYPLPQQRPIDEAATRKDLERIVAGHQRLWGILWGVKESDPGGFIERWLDEHAYKATDRWFGGVRLVLYSLPSEEAPATPFPLSSDFGHKVMLTGYSLEGSPSIRARGGDILPLTLSWQAIELMEDRYKVFVHLLDSHEHIWGQRDSEPGGGSRPTNQWSKGDRVLDRYGLPVYPGTPPGVYQIEVGLYREADGQRLPLMGEGQTIMGDRVMLGEIVVEKPSQPPPLESLLIPRPLKRDWGDLQLLGYHLTKLGVESALDLRSGDTAHLTLFWQAREKPSRNYSTILTLMDERDRPVLKWEEGPVDGSYSTSRWDKGEVVRDQYKLKLDASPGRYRLFLTVGIKDKPQPSPMDRVLLQEIAIK